MGNRRIKAVVAGRAILVGYNLYGVKACVFEDESWMAVSNSKTSTELELETIFDVLNDDKVAPNSKLTIYTSKRKIRNMIVKNRPTTPLESMFLIMIRDKEKEKNIKMSVRYSDREWSAKYLAAVQVEKFVVRHA